MNKDIAYHEGVALADWLNSRKRGITAAQKALASYVRWFNSGRKGPFPEKSRVLFTKPLRARLRRFGEALDIAGFGDLDQGILRLIRIGDAGLLSRLRECGHCRAWFFAKRDTRKFCSNHCREKAHLANIPREILRERRRQYMRAYRATLKTHPSLKIGEHKPNRRDKRDL
jgi:hypothetical protein